MVCSLTCGNKRNTTWGLSDVYLFLFVSYNSNTVFKKVKQLIFRNKLSPNMLEMASLANHNFKILLGGSILLDPIRWIANRTSLQFMPLLCFCGRRGDLMVSAFVPGSSGPGSSPGRGHCVVFLGKTLYSHSASLHPGV